jgi:hypothetical protein
MADLTIEELLSRSAEMMSQNLTAPTYRGVSTRAAQDDNATAKVSRDDLTNTITKEKSRYEDSVTSEKDAIKRVGQADSDKAIADQAQAEAIAQQVRDVNALLGLGTSPDAAIAKLAKENAELKPQADAELANIKQMQSTGPLDNPLEWLFNGIQLPSRIQSYNSAATKINNNQAAIEAGIATSNALATQLTRGLPSITVAQAKAAADKAKANADKLAADADQAFAKFNIDASNSRLAGDLAISRNTMGLTEMEIQQSRLRYESELNKVRFAESQATRYIQAAKNYEALKDMEQQRKVLERAEDMLGYEPGTLTPAAMKLMATTNKQKYDAIISLGQAGNFGASVLDAYETIHTVKLGPNASPDTVRVAGYLDEKMAGIKRTIMQGAEFKNKTPEEKRAIVATNLAETVKKDIIEAQKLGNFFHELSPAKVMAADKEFAGSNLGKILAPLAVTDKDITPELVVSTILANSAGNISAAGAMTADYYQKNIKLRNDTIPFKNVGSINVPTSYIVTFAGQDFDLTKPGDATKYAILQQLNSNVKYIPGFIKNPSIFAAGKGMNLGTKISNWMDEK